LPFLIGAEADVNLVTVIVRLSARSGAFDEGLQLRPDCGTDPSGRALGGHAIWVFGEGKRRCSVPM